MEFSAERLYGVLQSLPAAARYTVAFSGGVDSHVLLHALAALRPRLGAALRALHIDHRLQPDSRAWANHCLQVCAGLAVPCTVRVVDARPRPEESPEAAARRARYAALAAAMEPGELLLTAHHQDDQAETLLLQLLRGAGVRGLAAMPQLAPLGAGRLARPLLRFDRAALRAYAEAHALQWIEDASNLDLRFDRNFLRHAVLPPLQARWPGLIRVLARSGRHFAETSRLLDEVAAENLERCRGGRRGTLSITAIAALSLARRRNLLRFWLREQRLPTPDSAHLERIEREVVGARADAAPCVAWPGAEVRRYRDDLFAMAPLPPPPPALPIPWQPPATLSLPAGVGALHARLAVGEGVRLAALLAEPVSVRFRRGGERCRPHGRAHRRHLKLLFQEAGVPVWERARAPLVFVGERLAWAAQVGVCEPFAAAADEPGVVIVWQRTGAAIETGGENKEN